MSDYGGYPEVVVYCRYRRGMAFLENQANDHETLTQHANKKAYSRASKFRSNLLNLFYEDCCTSCAQFAHASRFFESHHVPAWLQVDPAGLAILKAISAAVWNRRKLELSCAYAQASPRPWAIDSSTFQGFGSSNYRLH